MISEPHDSNKSDISACVVFAISNLPLCVASLVKPHGVISLFVFKTKGAFLNKAMIPLNKHPSCFPPPWSSHCRVRKGNRKSGWRDFKQRDENGQHFKGVGEAAIEASQWWVLCNRYWVWMPYLYMYSRNTALRVSSYIDACTDVYLSPPSILLPEQAENWPSYPPFRGLCFLGMANMKTSRMDRYGLQWKGHQLCRWVQGWFIPHKASKGKELQVPAPKVFVPKGQVKLSKKISLICLYHSSIYVHAAVKVETPDKIAPGHDKM